MKHKEADLPTGSCATVQATALQGHMQVPVRFLMQFVSA
jgi:hypothetical protein